MKNLIKKTSHQTNFNHSQLIIEELLKENIQEFSVGLGYRHNPFLEALYQYSKENIINITSFFEERSIGFFALGKSKAMHQPTCIIVTSGTAVAELLPSVIEAYETNTPLLIITCDRPAKYRHSKFNQTIEQTHIFKHYSNLSIDLSLSDPLLETKALQSIIRRAAQVTKEGYIAHLNFQLQKPLINLKSNASDTHILPYHSYKYENNLKKESIHHLATILNGSKKGLIIVGEMQASFDADQILQLSKKLDAPIIADILSSIRPLGKDLYTSIPYYNTMISSNNLPLEKNYDYILHLGGRLTSLTLIDVLEKAKTNHYIQISNNNHPFNPNCTVTEFIHQDPHLFTSSIIDHIKERKNVHLAKQAILNSHFESSILKYFSKEEILSEPLIMHHLATLNKPYSFFLANSLTIRAGNDFFFPHNKIHNIYTNRGASGIDGNLATAIGAAEIEKRKKNHLIAIMGDLTLLYDLSSLLLLQQLRTPITIILFNNQGSGIAHSLPLKNQTEEYFNTFCQGKYSCNYRTLLQSFNIDYCNPSDLNSFKTDLSRALSNEKPSLIEVNTDPVYTNLCWKDNLHKFLKENPSSKSKFPYFNL